MSFIERLRAVKDAHKQLKDSSCVPCSAEFILKLYGRLKPDEFPLQIAWDGKPYGYGEVKRDLGKEGISADNISLDLAGLRIRADEEFKKETPLVFSWPVLIGLEPATEENLRPISFHMHTAIRDKHGVQHLVGFGSNGFVVPLCGWDVLWDRIRSHCPDYMIDVLIHRPI